MATPQDSIGTYYGNCGLALLSVSLICIEYFVVAYINVQMRAKTFTKEYMDKFSDEHKQSIGTWAAPALGFPDMGNGFYSQDLSYEQWFKFNNCQRCHYNFLEQLTPVIIWILISMMYQPLASGIMGLAYFVGRILYTIGYVKTANQRIIGAIILDLSYLGLFVLSLVTVGKWGQFF